MGTEIKMEVLDGEDYGAQASESSPEIAQEVDEPMDDVETEPSSSAQFERHWKRIESVDESDPHRVCHHCNKSVIMLSKGYVQASLLVSHSISHIDVKPYGCPLCKYSARFESNVRNHLRKGHREICGTIKNGPSLSQKLNETIKIKDNMDLETLIKFKDITLLCFPQERKRISDWYTRREIRYRQGDMKKRRRSEVDRSKFPAIKEFQKYQSEPIRKVATPIKKSSRSSLTGYPILFTEPFQKTLEIEKNHDKDENDELDTTDLFPKSPGSGGPTEQIASNSDGPLFNPEIKEEPNVDFLFPSASTSRIPPQIAIIHPKISNERRASLNRGIDEVSRVKAELRQKERDLMLKETIIQQLTKRLSTVKKLEAENETLRQRLAAKERRIEELEKGNLQGNEADRVGLSISLEEKEHRIRELEEQVSLHKKHKEKLQQMLGK